MTEFLTTAQAAEILTISLRGVHKAIERGRLLATKHSRRDWLIKREDVEAYKVSNRKPGRK